MRGPARGMNPSCQPGEKADCCCLTDHVTLGSPWPPKSGVVLCLNGKSITANFDGTAITGYGGLAHGGVLRS